MSFQKNISLLGATGFIGRWVAGELERRGLSWTGVDNNPAVAAGFAHRDRLDFFDCRDADALRAHFAARKPDVVLCLIGHGMEEDIGKQYRESTEAVFHAAEALSANTRFLFAGSAAEYGNAPDSGRLVESHPLYPVTPYGRAKAAQYEIVRSQQERGMRATHARIFNPIGPGQGKHLVAGALFHRLMQNERPLRVRACNFVRDWIDVRDAAAAFVHLALSEHTPAVVNVCSGTASTVEELALEIVTLCEGKLEPMYSEKNVDALWRSVGDPSLLESLAWKRTFDMKQSLRDQWIAAGSPKQTEELSLEKSANTSISASEESGTNSGS